MSLTINNSVKVKADKAGYVECWKLLKDDGETLRSIFWYDYTWQKGTWHEPKAPLSLLGRSDSAIIRGDALHVFLSRGGVEKMATEPEEMSYRCTFHIDSLIATGMTHPYGSCAAVSRLYLIEKVAL